MALPSRKATSFRVLSVGRVFHVKGLEFGLRAFAKFQAGFPDSSYRLIGDGPERKRLERLARKLGIEDKVVFCGNIPRKQVFTSLGECDVLLFPSLHDSGGWATLEAMAAGRPVICLDVGGPAMQVTPATGIKIPAITPTQVINDLTIALQQLATDPSRRIRLGGRARDRVENDFRLDRKGDDLAKLYTSLVRA